VAVLQEEVRVVQILPPVVMITLVAAVAVDQVVVDRPVRVESLAHLVDLVLLYSDIPFDKYQKDCYNPKYLKQI
jgi:hypothetical protein